MSFTTQEHDTGGIDRCRERGDINIQEPISISEAYENLANAIIRQAIDDYICVMRILEKNKDKVSANIKL